MSNVKAIAVGEKLDGSLELMQRTDGKNNAFSAETLFKGEARRGPKLLALHLSPTLLYKVSNAERIHTLLAQEKRVLFLLYRGRSPQLVARSTFLGSSKKVTSLV